MFIFFRLFAVVLSIFTMESAIAQSQDPCDRIDSTSNEVRVTLKNAALENKFYFIGTFQIQNLSKDQSITIRGLSDEKSNTFRIKSPDISIEYLDLLNRWERMIELPGSYYGVREKRVIPPGKSILVDVPLFSNDAASKNAREFRLLIRAQSPTICLISLPFRGYPPRPTVLRLENVDSDISH